jgi:CBS domain-containing protein
MEDTVLVKDLMTSEPLTVTGEWTVKEAVVLAARRRVSALPVVDARGSICGIVTEADLIRDGFAHDGRAHALPHDDADRSPARVVTEVMSSPAITVRERADLADVVELMTSARLKSIPVVDDDGRLVGMVSRSDVIRVRARGDEVLAQEINDMLASLEHPDWQVEVHEGVAEISGPEIRLDRSIAQLAANSVAGVVDVRLR